MKKCLSFLLPAFFVFVAILSGPAQSEAPSEQALNAVNGPSPEELEARVKSLSDSLTLLMNHYFSLQQNSSSIGQNVQQVNQNVQQVSQNMEQVNQNVQQVSQNVQQLQSSYQNINQQYQHFSKLLEDNEVSIKALTQARLAELKDEYQKKKDKVVMTPNFVKAANVSLSALTLSNTLADYLNDVAQLNNPENEELGVSISDAVTKIIDDHIFQNKSKVGKQSKPKFLEIVQSIINTPLIATGAAPVVGALNTVTNLVSSLAVSNDDVDVKAFEAYKAKVANYVVFYEALGKAGAQFDTKINNLGIRITALNNLLRNYAFERIETLQPDFASKHGIDMSLNDLLRRHYERDAVQNYIFGMERSSAAGSNQIDYSQLLRDKRLTYPDYALNQARFITDELEAINKEYIQAFYEYQTAIEKVMANGKDIVNPDKASKKVTSLRTKLTHLEKAFHTAVNVEDVQAQFQKLADEQF